jgi:hypothetical protein
MKTDPWYQDRLRTDNIKGQFKRTAVSHSCCMTVGTVPVYEHTKHLAKTRLQLVRRTPCLSVCAATFNMKTAHLPGSGQTYDKSLKTTCFRRQTRRTFTWAPGSSLVWSGQPSPLPQVRRKRSLFSVSFLQWKRLFAKTGSGLSLSRGESSEKLKRHRCLCVQLQQTLFERESWQHRRAKAVASSRLLPASGTITERGASSEVREPKTGIVYQDRLGTSKTNIRKFEN